ncbi:MAG: PilX N-terminal domain-containing pilus assembly protein, partial [Wenzhouxiangella sp.]|nr:PilX N-terminal domain-containing pilus assembly protein [Wenzhouxiangella sp.]
MNKRNGLARFSGGPQRARGVTLLIGLMILLVLIILGLTSSNVSMMQERMAGNFRESNLAFQAAEDTLREIEMRLQGMGGGTGGL